VVVAALLWAGYWVVGSRALDKASRQWFDDPRNNATYQSLDITGFPSRFDMTVTEPRFTDPGSRLEWAAPFLQLFTLTYQPWHIIAAFPPEQNLTGPNGAAILRAGKLQASLVLQPTSSLPLDRLTMVGDALTLESTDFAALSVENLRFATRPAPMRENTHEIGLNAANITTPTGDRVDALRLDAIVGLTAPLDRFAAQSRPEVTQFELRELLVQADAAQLTGAGTLQPDSAGYANGAVTITLTNWETALQMAAKAGVIRPETLTSWTNAGEFLAKQSPDPSEIRVDLVFSNGVVSLAGLPLGAAPRLAITGF
jgi:hypothetical protein